MNVLDFGSILLRLLTLLLLLLFLLLSSLLLLLLLLLLQLVVAADRRSGPVWQFSPEKEQAARGKSGERGGKNLRPGARTNLMRDIQKFVVAVVFAIVEIQFLCIRQARVVDSPLALLFAARHSKIVTMCRQCCACCSPFSLASLSCFYTCPAAATRSVVPCVCVLPFAHVAYT